MDRRQMKPRLNRLGQREYIGLLEQNNRGESSEHPLSAGRTGQRDT